MNRFSFQFFLISGILCFISPATAQQPESEPLPRPDDEPIHFEHLTNNDGLSQMSIYSMVQDRKGFVWVGTQNGLNKYDGYGFKVYYHDPDDDSSLQTGWVTALHEDAQGRLWVGTDVGGLSYLDPVTETFVHYRHDPAESTSLSDNSVWAILEDTQGMLWVGTQGGGLNRLDPQTETVTRFQHHPSDSTSLSDNWVTIILEDAHGMLWVGTWEGGLNRFDPVTETFTRYGNDPSDPTSLSHKHVSELYEDRQGMLWVGTQGGGLNRLDPATETFTRFEHDEDDPTSVLDNWISVIEEDSRGVLWIGTGSRIVRDGLSTSSTRGGLSRFDRATETFVHYQHDPQIPGSLLANNVESILADQQGVLWVGNNGLSRVDRSAKRFGLYRTDGRDAYGLRWGASFALYEDYTGVLWVRGGGVLNAFNRSTGAVTEYAHDPDNPQSIGPGGIRAMLEDHTGTLWLGNQWLNRFDRATGTFFHYKHNPDDPGSLGPGNIESIHEDRQGRLWIGHVGGGLDRLDVATGTFQHYRHDPQDSTNIGAGRIFAIHEDRDGVFWLVVGRGSKLDRFDPATGLFEHFSYEGGAFFISITERPGEPGIHWINTNQGLVRFDTRSEVWTRYTSQNSDLPNNRVYAALPDEAGHLWLSTEGGISRFNPDTGVFKNYDVDDGLQDKEFNHRSYHKSPSGEMFFGGINGINYFFPDQIEDNTTPPQVVITTFRLFNKLQRPGPDSLLTASISDTEVVSLAHNQNHVSFDYVGLHFRNPEKNQYTYMLEGYDADWQDAGTLRRANYTNLDPGDYIFRVKASNSDGVWNEEGASVRLLIAPPWWRTTWAYLLYGLLLIGGVFAVDRVQRRRLIRKERAQAELREKDLRAEAAEAMANYLQSENLRQTQELDAARDLQLSMLPETMPEHQTVALAAFMQTATEVGGDYYDFNLADDGTLTLAIGDATGHGTKAGTMVTATKSLWHAFSGEPDLVVVLQKSSRALKQMGLPKLYMALALARVQDHTLELAGAGMPPALVYRAATRHVETIPLKGMPLGGPGTFPYQKTCVLLSAGDTVMLMSDGFPELFNAEGEMLGYERAVTVFDEVADRSPEEIIEHFKESASTWMNGRAQDDDVTFLVMRVKEG